MHGSGQLGPPGWLSTYAIMHLCYYAKPFFWSFFCEDKQRLLESQVVSMVTLVYHPSFLIAKRNQTRFGECKSLASKDWEVSSHYKDKMQLHIILTVDEMTFLANTP